MCLVQLHTHTHTQWQNIQCVLKMYTVHSFLDHSSSSARQIIIIFVGFFILIKCVFVSEKYLLTHFLTFLFSLLWYLCGLLFWWLWSSVVYFSYYSTISITSLILCPILWTCFWFFCPLFDYFLDFIHFVFMCYNQQNI